jgi:outer membrane receptor protein involved in Fe transport
MIRCLIMLGMLMGEPGPVPPPPAPADDAWEAGEVVITDRRRPTIEAAGTVTILTGVDVAARGARTLADALEMIPGAEVVVHKKGHARLRLRGFGQDKIMVRVDGVPINDVYSTDIDLSTIPVSNIARIIVNRGTSSALYGTDGAIGSINVITRRPTRPFLEGRAEWGPADSTLYNLAHGMPVGRAWYWITGTLETSGGYAPSRQLTPSRRRAWFDRIIRYDLYPAGDIWGDGAGQTIDDVTIPAASQYLAEQGLWDHNSFLRAVASARVGGRLAPGVEGSLSASFYWFDGRTGGYEVNAYNQYRGNQWKSSYPTFAGGQEDVKKFALRFRGFEWPALWRIIVAPAITADVGRWQLRANLHLLLYHHEQIGWADAGHTLTKGESMQLKPENVYDPFADMKDFTTIGGRVSASYRFSPTHRLTIGSQVRHDQYLGSERALSPSRSPELYAARGGGRVPVEVLGAQTFTLALEDELELWDRLALNAGVSYDMQHVQTSRVRDAGRMVDRYVVRDRSLILGTRDALSPVLGVVFDPIEELLRLRVSGSMRTRFPTLSEYSKIGASDADQDLRPERSWNLNAGIELTVLDRALSVRSDYFLALVDDRIEKIHKDEPPVNVDRAEVHGVETIVEARLPGILPWLDLQASVAHTFLHARNEDHSASEKVNKGPWLEFTPEHQVTWDLRIGLDTGTRLTLWGRSSIGQRIYTMKRRPAGQDAPYSTDLFTTVRLHDPVFLNLQITQSVGPHLEISARATNLLDDYSPDPFNPGPGRQFWIGLKAAL